MRADYYRKFFLNDVIIIFILTVIFMLDAGILFSRNNVIKFNLQLSFTGAAPCRIIHLKLPQKDKMKFKKV